MGFPTRVIGATGGSERVGGACFGCPRRKDDSGIFGTSHYSEAPYFFEVRCKIGLCSLSLVEAFLPMTFPTLKRVSLEQCSNNNRNVPTIVEKSNERLHAKKLREACAPDFKHTNIGQNIVSLGLTGPDSPQNWVAVKELKLLYRRNPSNYYIYTLW